MAIHLIPISNIMLKYEGMLCQHSPLMSIVGDPYLHLNILLNAVTALITRRDLKRSALKEYYIEMGIPTDIADGLLDQAVTMFDQYFSQFVSEKIHYTSHFCQFDGSQDRVSITELGE